MSFIKEFREFAMRGNVVDLAVGVIIGAAFGKIVSSLVADIIMPPLGLLIGGIDFKQFAVTLRDAQGDVPAVVMHYGVFIQNIFDFVIVAFAIFMAIKLINKFLCIYKKHPFTCMACIHSDSCCNHTLTNTRWSDDNDVFMCCKEVVSVNPKLGQLLIEF